MEVIEFVAKAEKEIRKKRTLSAAKLKTKGFKFDRYEANELMNNTIIIPSHESYLAIISCDSDATFDIQCQPNSQCHILIEHEVGAITCTVSLARDSYCTMVFVGNTAQASSVTCTVALQDAGAQASLVGIYRVYGGNVTHVTQQLHEAPHTTSSLCMRKIVYEAAHAIYTGMIRIEPAAQHADAVQQDKTLLLGQKSCAESIPSIEVSTNDVRCAHGSAIGRTDIKHLLYMQSRGLSQQRASVLLCDGFLRDGIDTIEHAQLRNHAMEYLGIAS